MTAPTTLGVYQVEVRGTDTGPTGMGAGALTSGGGLKINFTVSECEPMCEEHHTVLMVAAINCIALHDPNLVALSATLTDSDNSNSPISGQTLHFSVDGNPVGDPVTNASGVATINYDASGLGVGDHAVDVTFDGVPCPTSPAYLGTTASGNLGVNYQCSCSTAD